MRIQILVLSLIFFISAPFVGVAQKKVSRSNHIDVFSSKSDSRKPKQTISTFDWLDTSGCQITLKSPTGTEEVTYNSKLEVVENVKTKRKELPDYDSEVWSIVDFGDKRMLLRGMTDKSAQLNTVSISDLDTSNVPINDGTEITRIEGEQYYEDLRNAYLTTKQSPNGLKLLVMLKLAETRDDANLPVQNFRFIVFNERMEKDWEKDVSFESSEGKSRVGGSNWFYNSNMNAFRLSDSGNIFSWTTIDRGRGVPKEERFQTQLLSISGDETSYETLEGVNSSKWTMSITGDRLMMLSLSYIKGFDLFGIVLKQWGKEGFQLVSWDGNSKPEVQLVAFKAEHLKDNQSTKVKKRAKKWESKSKPVLIPNYEMDHIYALEDGSHLVAGQEQYAVVSTSSSGLTSRVKYYNRDIHLFNLSSDGEINWSYNIPLNQYTAGEGQGYVMKVIGTKVYIVFNDNFRNLEKNWNTSKKANKFTSIDNPVVLVTFDMADPEAKQKRELLWKSKAVSGLFDPQKYYSENESNLGLVYIQGGRLKQRLLRLEYH